MEVMVGVAVTVTRLNCSAAELRRQASRCDDGRIACRILAIANVIDGASRTDAAQACGMDRQTLRDWVHRYNANGIAGLADAPRTGRPPALSPDQMASLKALALAGPDLAVDGVVRWRCVDLQGAFMSYPKEHRTKIHSTNPLERVNGEIKRRTDVVGVFPNEAAVTRLVGAILLEQNDEWAIQRRYMSLETLAPISDVPDVSLPAVAA